MRFHIIIKPAYYHSLLFLIALCDMFYIHRAKFIVIFRAARTQIRRRYYSHLPGKTYR